MAVVNASNKLRVVVGRDNDLVDPASDFGELALRPMITCSYATKSPSLPLSSESSESTGFIGASAKQSVAISKSSRAPPA